MENKTAEKTQTVKRGRKPKDRIYFGEVQEQAVLEYVKYYNIIDNANKEILKKTFNCNDEQINDLIKDNTIFSLMETAKNTPIEDREVLQEITNLEIEISQAQKQLNQIYNDTLKVPFKKMIEALIRGGRGLYTPNEEFQETYDDTLSHLMLQMGHYNKGKGRAYSYYSNICKNYLLSKKDIYQKSLIRNPSYDTIDFDLGNDIKYSDKPDKGKRIAAEEVKCLMERIQKYLNSPEEYGLRENEIKVGEALINLFENWDYVLPLDNNKNKPSPKLIKSVVFLFLRKSTGLDTKGIRDSLKFYKKEFLIIKKCIIG